MTRQRPPALALVLTVAAALLVVDAPPAAAAALEVKVASLAPRGSAWAKIMERGAKVIEARTQGRVKVRYFFSGSQGDERDVVRKMKVGQLDGAALTAVGLGQIKPEVRILELPFLFRTDRELDYVRERMQPDFERQFLDAGYVLLAWGDVGWVHVYSAFPVDSLQALRRAKMWAWTDDPIVRAFFRRVRVNGVPLGVPDVLPALQTGAIDACYTSPLAAVALQWYTKVKYATATPISYSVGAIVVRKEVHDKLSPSDQKIVAAEATRMGRELMAIVRRDNERAKRAMKRSGVAFVKMPAAFEAQLRKHGQALWDELAGGKLYSDALLATLRKHLANAQKAAR